MNIAVCFKGLIDEHEDSYDNIKMNIYDSLKESEHFCVSFATTTYIDKDSLSSFVEKYSPAKILLNQDRKNVRWNETRSTLSDIKIVPFQLIECIEMVEEYEKEKHISFDVIMIIRPDISFNQSLDKYEIDKEKVNMECMFVPDLNSGDCFFWIPKKWKDLVKKSFLEILKTKGSSHKAWKYFQQNEIPVHYVCGETSKRNPEYDVMFRFTRYIN